MFQLISVLWEWLCTNYHSLKTTSAKLESCFLNNNSVYLFLCFTERCKKKNWWSLPIAQTIFLRQLAQTNVSSHAIVLYSGGILSALYSCLHLLSLWFLRCKRLITLFTLDHALSIGVGKGRSFFAILHQSCNLAILQAIDMAHVVICQCCTAHSCSYVGFSFTCILHGLKLPIQPYCYCIIR